MAELATSEETGVNSAAELLAVGSALLGGGGVGAGLLIAEDIGMAVALTLADIELLIGNALLMGLGVGGAPGLGFVAPGIGTSVALLHLWGGQKVSSHRHCEEGLDGKRHTHIG